MVQNPYKYLGPLDPFRDGLVCVPRKKEVEQIVNRIPHGNYWAIIGPRQIGKTTFLRQLKIKVPEMHCIHIDLTACPEKEKDFYPWFINEIVRNKLPGEQIKITGIERYNSPLAFLEFLRSFKAMEVKRRIVLFLDEIESAPDLNSFLHIWRKFYIEEYNKDKTNNFAVIITGSIDLIKATYGKTSPFNIAKTLFLKDFSNDETKQLIDKPFSELGITIEEDAKNRLMFELSGHPSLLQEACFKLVEIASEEKRTILEDDINNVVKILFKESFAFDTLRMDIELNTILENLVRSILKGQKNEYHIYKEFSVLGAGSITEDEEGMCAIRNNAYRQFLDDLIKAKIVQKKRAPKGN